MIKQLLNNWCFVVSCDTEFYRSSHNNLPYATIDCELFSKDGLSEMRIRESFKTKEAFDETYKLLVAHWRGETT